MKRPATVAAVGWLFLAACGRVDYDSLGRRQALAAGQAHTCAIARGRLLCWGANADGQLGLGDAQDRTLPEAVDERLDWSQVTTGARHTCALRLGGQLACWGANDRGQLGVGDTTPRSRPTPVALPAPAVAISTSFDHTCARLTDGTIACWGENLEGQLGLGVLPDGPPVLVPTPPDLDGCSDVACGQGHTIALQGGRLMGSGRNTADELGLGDGALGQYLTFVPIDDGAWSRVAAGQNMSCGIRTDGELSCWGTNAYGSLGTGDLLSRTVPTPAATAGPWGDLAVNTFHGCALRTDGHLFCWGRNTEGQLGTGDNVDRLQPVETGSDTDDWAAVSTGRFHSCAQRSDGTVFCTGVNLGGELGLGDLVSRATWTEVRLPRP